MSNPKIFTLDNLSLQDFDSDAELIPLLTPEDEEEIAYTMSADDMLDDDDESLARPDQSQGRNPQRQDNRGPRPQQGQQNQQNQNRNNQNRNNQNQNRGPRNPR